MKAATVVTFVAVSNQFVAPRESEERGQQERMGWRCRYRRLMVGSKGVAGRAGDGSGRSD